jgi:hypothetical protein
MMANSGPILASDTPERAFSVRRTEIFSEVFLGESVSHRQLARGGWSKTDIRGKVIVPL